MNLEPRPIPPDSELTRAERVALKYCELQKLEPGEMINFPHPKGYAVARYAPRYKVLALEAEKRLHWQLAIASVTE